MILLQQSSSSALWDELERVLTRLRAHARQQVERTDFEASGLGAFPIVWGAADFLRSRIRKPLRSDGIPRPSCRPCSG